MQYNDKSLIFIALCTNLAKTRVNKTRALQNPRCVKNIPLSMSDSNFLIHLYVDETNDGVYNERMLIAIKQCFREATP